jgi:hypothetical protein
MFIDRMAWLPAVVLGSAALTFFALRKTTIESTFEPSLGEWLLGALSIVGKQAIGSLMGLMLFGLFYGGAKLFVWAVGLAGIAAHADLASWAFWGSISFVILSIVAVATQSAKRVLLQLYPLETGTRSAFFPLLARPSRLILGAVATVAALAIMLWLLDPHGIALAVLLSIVLYYTSLPLMLAGRELPDVDRLKVVRALTTLLQESGYRVVRTPRTGKAEIDPLLKSVDLLAKRSDRAFAVQVKSITSRAPVEWNEASALRTAAVLLSDEILTSSAARMPVEPVLILVGGTIAQSLAAFSQRERVPVVHFEGIADAIATREELVRRLQAVGLAFPSSQAASSAPA